MATEKQLQANRANAQASTGPRTMRGKARACQNARSHGLSISVLMDPRLAAEVEKLAREIAGEDASPARLVLARRFAEPQVELGRIREVRKACLAQVSEINTERRKPGALDNHDALSRVAADLTRKLLALDRYERRALSRRKFAIRDFDATCRRRNDCLGLEQKAEEVDVVGSYSYQHQFWQNEPNSSVQ